MKTLTFASILAISATFLAAPGCSPTAADVPAEATPAPATAEPVQAATPDGALPLVTDTSSVGFTGAKITMQHKGGFEQIEGSVTLDGDTVSALSVTVHTASVWTDGSDRLTSHLRDGAFFDVENHPTATFVMTALEPLEGGDATHRVTGDLTLRGVTKSVSFDGKITVEATRVQGSATFPIDRKDYGIVYPGMPDDLIKDEVELALELTFGKG